MDVAEAEGAVQVAMVLLAGEEFVARLESVAARARRRVVVMAVEERRGADNKSSNEN